jgi:hypothetical protein
LALNSTAPSCGLNNGTITANVTGGTGHYTYTWNNGNTTSTINNLGAGLFSVTVNDGSGCTAHDSVSLFVGSAIFLTPSSTSATCGSNNGSVAVVAAPPYGGYTYAWSNGAIKDTVFDLPPGNYTVTVTAQAGCTVTASVTVNDSSNLALTEITNATTCGNANGSITLTTAGGTSPYSYAWSNGSTTKNLTNLHPGHYTVTVTSTGGCSATAAASVDTSTAIQLSGFGGRSSCTNTGTALVSVTEGNGPFTYLWSNGATTASLSSIAAGNYLVTVTGAGGCTAVDSVTVTSAVSPVTLLASATPSGCTDSTGSASVTVTTGNSPFTYAWSNGGTASAIQNLTIGAYTVTVNGSGGCSATASVNVTGSGAINVTTFSTAAGCGLNNGVAEVTNTGGPFTYAWSNGTTTDTISNVAAGTYTVTVQTGGACSGTASVIINSTGGSISIQAQPPAVCPGDTSQICAPAGFTTYHWNVGASTPCISVTQAGNYYVTVTGSGNCTATSNQVTLTINTPDTVTITQLGDTLKASGALSYQWYLNGSAIAGATSTVYVVSQSGSYYAEGSGLNGCAGKSNTEVLKGVTGIGQISDISDVKVYPNPLANGSWHLDVTSDWIGSDCEVYDAAGRLILRTEIKGTQSEMELNVAQGIYLMRINSAQKNYAIKLT